MTCPKCNTGRMFLDRAIATLESLGEMEFTCLNCGFTPPVAIPDNIDLSMQTPRHSASKARQPQPWEFTDAGVYAVDARGEHPTTPQPSQQRTRGGRG